MRGIGFVVLSLFIVGCADRDELRALQSRVDGLELEVKSLREGTATVDESIADELKTLTSSVVELQSLDPFAPTAAYLEIGTDGYSVATTQYGRVAVFIEDVKAFGSGSRVDIRLLNLASATLTDVTADVKYRNWAFGDLGKMSTEDMLSKSADIKLSESLKPGVAKRVQLNLPGMQIEQIKIVAITVAAGGLRYVKE